MRGPKCRGLHHEIAEAQDVAHELRATRRHLPAMITHDIAKDYIDALRTEQAMGRAGFSLNRRQSSLHLFARAWVESLAHANTSARPSPWQPCRATVSCCTAGRPVLPWRRSGCERPIHGCYKLVELALELE